MKTLAAYLIAVLAVLFMPPPVVAQDKPAKKSELPAEKPRPEKKKPAEKEKQQKKEKTKALARMMLETQKYFPMQKGNWWEYKILIERPSEKVVERAERIEITDIREGRCILKSTCKRGSSETELFVKDGFLVRTTPVGAEVRILKLPLKKGEKWTTTLKSGTGETDAHTYEHSVVAIETVKTSAGTFNNAVRVVSVSAEPAVQGLEKPVITWWFVPDVGQVKYVNCLGEMKFTQILAKYHVQTSGQKALAQAVAASELVVVASVKEPEEKETVSVSWTTVRATDEAAKKAEEAQKKAKLEEERKAREKAGEREKKVAEGKPAEEPAGKLIQVRLAVEKVLKGKLDKKEILVSVKEKLAKGKWVLFLDKLEKKARLLIRPPLPADKDVLKKLDSILNPPKPSTIAQKVAAADYVIIAKALVREERESFAYWVFEIEETLKGDKSRTHVDVLLTVRSLVVNKGGRYILTLKACRHLGRKFYKVIGEKLDAYSEKKLEEFKKALKR
jgi:hypothetical protein